MKSLAENFILKEPQANLYSKVSETDHEFVVSEILFWPSEINLLTPPRNNNPQLSSFGKRIWTQFEWHN